MTTRPRRRHGIRIVDGSTGVVGSPFAAVEHEPEPQPAPEPQPDPVELAYERGRCEGAAEAQAAADAAHARELDAIRAELADALAGLAGAERRLREQTTALMGELALEAATRIVRERIDGGDPVAARAMCAAIEALPDIEAVIARVHPDDLEAVRARLAEHPDAGTIELQPDERIARGGCAVDGRAGSIDARLETALAAVRDAALGETAESR